MNNKSNKFSPEVRERAVRMVQEHQPVQARADEHAYSA
jgi:transposase-like protein